MDAESNSKGVTPPKKTVRIADEAIQSKTEDPSPQKSRKSSLDKAPRCRGHWALAFLLTDEQLDAHELSAPLPEHYSVGFKRNLVTMILRDKAKVVWPRATRGGVSTPDKQTHWAVILAHNRSAATRKAPSKEQAEKMKKLMEITWDPHWYRCQIVDEN